MTVADEVLLHTALDGEGPPVLLIHGFPQTWYAWRRVLPLLAGRFQVIAPDYRGAGLSDRPASGYSKHVMARDLRALVRSIGSEPVAVVGHDIGAMIAYAYAAQFPDEVRSLTLIDAPIPGTKTWERVARSPKIWHFGFHATRDLAEHLVAGRERAYIWHFIRTRLGNASALSEEDVAVYTAAYSLPGALRSAFELYRSFEEDASDNAESVRAGLPMPVLAIGGGLTTSGPLMKETAAELSEEARAIVLQGVGHWIPEEAPDELVEHLLAVL
ncbi:MAG: alpha/beta hydrolase [Holophagales bacterium]|nr:alpha/beta hydrolase [Holophagales bacterium]